MSESPDDTGKVHDVLAAHAKQICEDMAFDTLDIVATVLRSDGNTQLYCAGHGNKFARLGAMRDTLIREDELTKIDTRKANQ